MPRTAKSASKTLRQSSLVDHINGSHPKPTKRKRPQKSPSPAVESDSDDATGLKMSLSQPKPEDIDHSPPKKRRTARIVDSDEEEQLPRPPRKGISKAIVIDDDDDLDSAPKPPRKRKLAKGSKPKVPSPAESSDDLDEDRIISSRLRTRNKMTPFQKNLERLKRKKQGKPIEELSGSQEDSNDDNEEEEDKDAPFKGSRKGFISSSESEHNSLFDPDSDEDFIVEDDGNAAAMLPKEFSMDTHQDLAHHFKVVFQFFVHIAVRPAGEREAFMEKQMREEQYFSVPVIMARRKVVGLRDSLVASSVWRPDFKKPLEKFPQFERLPLAFAVPSCDACHLGGRMSTVCGRLSGVPYRRDGFEEDTSDSDSDSDEEHKLKKPKLEFQLGRFCAKRTEVFHSLTHWEYSLFQAIALEVEELQMAGRHGKKFVRVAYAEGKTPPEDTEDADAICEWLDERRVIDTEWQKLKSLMESARNLEVAAKRGDADE
ncbi:hypothetical protein C8J56DRAFT_1015417 [Mycena floridula]|nr:hypothetical protein C8J56DRAFT_1015417 [Mycena floridula]